MKGKEADWAQRCTPTLQQSWMRAGRSVTCLHIVDIFVKKNLVDLYLGLVFCSANLNVCSQARTKLLCPYSSCSTTWEHVWWYLQCCSRFSGSCWLSGIILHELFFFYFCEEYDWNFIRNSIEFVEKFLLHWSSVLPTSRAFNFLFQVSLPVLGLLQGIFTSYFTGQLYMRLSFWFLLCHFLLLDKKATNCCILILYSVTLLKLLVYTKYWKACTYKIMLHVNTL